VFKKIIINAPRILDMTYIYGLDFFFFQMRLIIRDKWSKMLFADQNLWIIRLTDTRDICIYLWIHQISWIIRSISGYLYTYETDTYIIFIQRCEHRCHAINYHGYPFASIVATMNFYWQLINCLGKFLVLRTCMKTVL